MNMIMVTVVDNPLYYYKLLLGCYTRCMVTQHELQLNKHAQVVYMTVLRARKWLTQFSLS